MRKAVPFSSFKDPRRECQVQAAALCEAFAACFLAAAFSSSTSKKVFFSVSTPQPDILKETETPAPPETEETPSETDFDINYWISFAKDYAQSVGLLLDSEAVYCWDNPIRAGAHCKYLERDIHSRLDRYKADEEITAVWIWAEEVSDGIYDIYIGYA